MLLLEANNDLSYKILIRECCLHTDFVLAYLMFAHRSANLLQPVEPGSMKNTYLLYFYFILRNLRVSLLAFCWSLYCEVDGEHQYNYFLITNTSFCVLMVTFL